MFKVENIKTAEMLQSESLSVKQQQVKSEATRRIEMKWDKNGQANVALGLYSEAVSQSCKDWINAHRVVVNALLDNPNLPTIDLQTYEGWPT